MIEISNLNKNIVLWPQKTTSTWNSLLNKYKKHLIMNKKENKRKQLPEDY